eukprot:UN07554
MKTSVAIITAVTRISELAGPVFSTWWIFYVDVQLESVHKSRDTGERGH